jgi:hypothetical protein
LAIIFSLIRNKESEYVLILQILKARKVDSRIESIYSLRISWHSVPTSVPALISKKIRILNINRTFNTSSEYLKA